MLLHAAHKPRCVLFLLHAGTGALPSPVPALICQLERACYGVPDKR